MEELLSSFPVSRVMTDPLALLNPYGNGKLSALWPTCTLDTSTKHRCLQEGLGSILVLLNYGNNIHCTFH